VVDATLALEQFQNFYDTFNVGDNGVITLTNGVGTIVVRRPFNEANVGRTMAGSVIFRDYVDASESRSFEYKALLDSEIRLGSYHRVRGFDLVVIVGRQKSEVLSTWWLEAKTDFLVMLATLLLIAALGWYLKRQIDKRLLVERQLAAANEELTAISLLDPLTGIANRRHFDQALLKEWKRAMREGTALALLLVDADHFKNYNDLYGHQQGDACLRAIAHTLANGIHRPGDLAGQFNALYCRLGGAVGFMQRISS
jgi:predicted signal transduction protein with EAL and GGDEF domain